MQTPEHERQPCGAVLRGYRAAAGLSQEELAERPGLSRRTISDLERGATGAPYRSTVALLAEALGLDAPQRAALEKAARRASPTSGAPLAPADAAGAVAEPLWRHDWGDVPAVPALQGRSKELATLARWVQEERCRVVQVLGAGGIGKTALAARLAQDLAPAFAVLYWRSLRNAPPVEEWLAGALAALSTGQAVAPDGLDARLGLLGLLRGRRALLVLDNLESVLEPGAPLVRYRAGYGAVLAQLAESGHQGCLLLTSREQPLHDDAGAVRALRLDGLGVAEGRALLARRALAGDDAAWGALVARYGGNPLALGVLGETIGIVFGGEIAAFLAQEAAVFGDIRALLDGQVARLSPLEQAILLWLAVEREPVGFAELVADLGPGVARGAAVEAVEALARRSLLERGGRTWTSRGPCRCAATASAQPAASSTRPARGVRPTAYPRTALCWCGRTASSPGSPPTPAMPCRPPSQAYWQRSSIGRYAGR
jgi:transcriptional regulator with XRE-family HTH domain